jgi:uncharacterized protein
MTGNDSDFGQTLPVCLTQSGGGANSLMRGLAVALFFILSFAPVVAAEQYSPPQGFVNDFAGIIDASTRSAMEAMLRNLQAQTGIEIAVVTVNSLGDRSIEEYANELFRQWGVGGKQENTGLLLLVAPNERQYRIEVGYGLEADIPDGLAGEIGRRMKPYFRQQAYGDGIMLAVRSIIATLAEKRGFDFEGIDRSLAYRSSQRQPSSGGTGGFGLFLLILIFLVVFIIAASDAGRGGGSGRGGRRRRYYRGSDWLWYPIIFGGGGSGGFGGHGGGGSSWGGFSGGGGGFGGFGGFGGGSSGGGGASGSW